MFNLLGANGKAVGRAAVRLAIICGQEDCELDQHLAGRFEVLRFWFMAKKYGKTKMTALNYPQHRKTPELVRFRGFSLVAGAGFEPTTSGL